MTTLGKAVAAFALALSASALMPIRNQAHAASVIEQCQQQVKQIWPQTNMEYQRTEHDLVRASVQNGGRIPG
jgi:hypothetical protein